MTAVTVEANGHRIVSAITTQAAKDLALKTNEPITALVKSTEIMLLKGAASHVKLSARNVLSGRIISVQKGQAMASVTIEASHLRLTSAITREAADELELRNDDHVVAAFKATDVLLQKG